MSSVVDTFVKTDIFILDAEIGVELGLDEVPDGGAFQVCAGEWRREGAGWRFYRDPEWDD